MRPSALADRNHLALSVEGLALGAIEVLLVVGLTRREEGRDVGETAVDRPLEPSPVGDEAPVADVVRLRQPCDHLSGVCEPRGIQLGRTKLDTSMSFTPESTRP